MSQGVSWSVRERLTYKDAAHLKLIQLPFPRLRFFEIHIRINPKKEKWSAKKKLIFKSSGKSIILVNIQTIVNIENYD